MSASCAASRVAQHGVDRRELLPRSSSSMSWIVFHSSFPATAADAHAVVDALLPDERAQPVLAPRRGARRDLRTMPSTARSTEEATRRTASPSGSSSSLRARRGASSARASTSSRRLRADRPRGRFCSRASFSTRGTKTSTWRCPSHPAGAPTPTTGRGARTSTTVPIAIPADHAGPGGAFVRRRRRRARAARPPVLCLTRASPTSSGRLTSARTPPRRSKSGGRTSPTSAARTAGTRARARPRRAS